MKPAPLEYHRARDVDEAIALVAGHEGFAKFLAGGQTLGPMINLRLAQPDLVVDISRIDALRGVSEESDRILVGAATPHAAFEDGIVPDAANGLLRHAAAAIAYRAVRNRGTLGGSLAHADPSAEWPAVMLALGATIHVQGARGRREVAAGELVRGAMTTTLTDDELIEAVTIPRLTRAGRWGFYKRCRKVGEFAHSLCVVILDPERGMNRAVIGAVGGAPRCLEGTSRMLGGMRAWRDGCEADIRTAYEADIDTIGLAFDEYDRHVHGLAVIRAARKALAS